MPLAVFVIGTCSERARILSPSRPPLCQRSTMNPVARNWGGVEARSLYLPRPHIHFFPITDVSMLFRVRSTTNTPGALVESLTEAEHSAIAEAHTPHEGRIFRMRRPRPIVGRLDSHKRMARRKSRARRGNGGIHQTGQLCEGRQTPAFSAPDGFIGAGQADVCRGYRCCLRGLFPDQPGFLIQYRVAVEGLQDDEPLRHRQHLVPPQRVIVFGTSTTALSGLSTPSVTLGGRQDLIELVQNLPKLLLL